MQDSILFWNAVAIEANRISHTDPDKRQQNGPTLSSRAIAIVHLAMYDAFAAVAGGLPPYLSAPSGLPPSTARDAVAGAAHRTLSRLYSAQVDFFNAQLSGFNTGPTSPSYVFGEMVGQALLDLRANDMDGRDCGYLPSTGRGRHRKDPDNPGQGFNSPFYGAQTRTFAVKKRHTLDRPPFGNGNDPKYLRALRDVRAQGIRPDLTATLPTPQLFGRRRTPEKTLIGIYWGYDGANRLGTPPRLFNQIIRQVAMNTINPSTGAINGEAENARLFAFVNAAMGDAGILAWEQKYCHDFWRPVVGIREHDETLGPAAPYNVNANFDEGDPGWLPLGAPSTNSTGTKNFTPDFPAYPSGHATFGAAALHIARMFYGINATNKSNDNLVRDDMGRPLFVSDEFNGGNRDNDGTVRPRHTRPFPGGLWQMILENGLSRVYLGVHWIFDAFDFTGGANGPLNPSLADERIGGVGLGLRIARDIFAWGNGNGPKMTPIGIDPPITTPDPTTVPPPAMPTTPAQPGSIKGCASTLAPGSFTAAAAVKGRGKGSAKKGLAKVTGKKGAVATGAEIATPEDQGPWPAGISEQDGDQAGSSGQGAWPSGISEK
ncbi:MAG: phosphatase PAP2 family protein [Acidobacteriota bacterium]|nr:phosphatase PAP2 family protein [Acidobacteriota bacterium]